MEGESGFTRSIIYELHSSNMKRDQTEGESDFTQSNIDELDFSDIQGVQMEGESDDDSKYL